MRRHLPDGSYEDWKVEELYTHIYLHWNASARMKQECIMVLAGKFNLTVNTDVAAGLSGRLAELSGSDVLVSL